MRADKFFAEKFGSRTKAAEAIERGLVLVNGKPIKPKTEVADTDAVSFVVADEIFVSNGGYKLSRAIRAFSYDCQGKICVDIGASTGGFTDCLLQNGAQKVYTVDVGESLLHESLLGNAKIFQMENTNARYLTKSDFEEEIDCVVADVSFISLRLIFPVIQQILGDNGDAFVLVKPQFECEKKHIGKSGIVAPSAHSDIFKKVLRYLSESGLYACGVVNAPVRKGKNVEYILRISKKHQSAQTDEKIIEQVKLFVKQNSLGELQ